MYFYIEIDIVILSVHNALNFITITVFITLKVYHGVHMYHEY